MMIEFLTRNRFLTAGVLLALLAGCHKSSKKENINTHPTNPVTAVAVCDFDFNDTTLTNHGWTKSFEDNFNGSLSNWNVLQGGVQNELECNEPANVQIVNGALQITARQETITGPKTVGNDTTKSFNYTSGWITSKLPLASANSATPKVRIVARIKVALGYGLTSIFYGFAGNWPTNGEIDYLEASGADTKTYITDYAYGTQPGVNVATGAFLYNPTTESLASCYHVFTMEWTRNSLNSFLDGKLVEAKTTGGHIPDLFGKSHNFAISLPIGGGYYGSLNTANIAGGTLYVDYVKVFTSN
jgi:hypothetical protein